MRHVAKYPKSDKSGHLMIEYSNDFIPLTLAE